MVMFVVSLYMRSKYGGKCSMLGILGGLDLIEMLKLERQNWRDGSPVYIDHRSLYLSFLDGIIPPTNRCEQFGEFSLVINELRFCQVTERSKPARLDQHSRFLRS